MLGPLVEALVPPAGLRKSQRGTKPKPRRSKRKKPARISFTGASVHFLELCLEYSTVVNVPESFRTGSYAGPQQSRMQFSISQVSASPYTSHLTYGCRRRRFVLDLRGVRLQIGADLSLPEKSVSAAANTVQLVFMEGQRPVMEALLLDSLQCTAHAALASKEGGSQSSVVVDVSGLQGPPFKQCIRTSISHHAMLSHFHPPCSSMPCFTCLALI